MKWVAVGLLVLTVACIVVWLSGTTVHAPTTDDITDEQADSPTTEGDNPAERTVPAANDPVIFTIDTTQLNDSQKAVLNTMGVKEDYIPVTASMYACAEAKIGADRMSEIQAGAAPGPLEAMSLLGCYKN